jgi:hypothetical protein
MTMHSNAAGGRGLCNSEKPRSRIERREEKPGYRNLRAESAQRNIIIPEGDDEQNANAMERRCGAFSRRFASMYRYYNVLRRDTPTWLSKLLWVYFWTMDFTKIRE